MTLSWASLLAVAEMLTMFSDARVIGATILASAGIAGVVVGIAARPVTSNLLAGVQILFSEPISYFLDRPFGNWTRRSAPLLMADAGHGYVERRALMSAPGAPTGWDLRCAVREGLLNYVKRRHGESLPRTRAMLQHTNGERA